MVLLKQLLLPLGALLLAAVFEFQLADHPSLALFLAWLLMAIAALLLLLQVRDLLRNEAGLLDAAALVTLAWFVMLSSALGAASVWNVHLWRSGDLNAFVEIPGHLWVLAGLPVLANVGMRAVYLMRDGSGARALVHVTPMQQLLSSPLDPSAKPQIGNAQYLMLNLIVLIVYAIAIGQLFSVVGATTLVQRFPDIPEPVLGLIGVSVGGFITATAAFTKPSIVTR